MFSFFGKGKKGVQDFSEVAVDMHSHLLPGVDDGSQSVKQSIELITGLQELGFQHLVTTPHSMNDMYPNSLATLKNSFNKLKGVIPEGIRLDYSSEYFLDELFIENLRRDQLKPLPGNRILIEFSMANVPMNLEEILFEIRLKGYQIILAHPERFVFFHKQPKAYSRFKDLDIEFQVNALSLSGYYGNHIKKMAENLIDEGWIDFIGTDLHHERHLSALRKVTEMKSFEKLLKSNGLKNQTLIS